jgi:hypothetical protein
VQGRIDFRARHPLEVSQHAFEKQTERYNFVRPESAW